MNRPPTISVALSQTISSKIVCTSVYLDLDLAFPDLVAIMIDI